MSAEEKVMKNTASATTWPTISPALGTAPDAHTATGKTSNTNPLKIAKALLLFIACTLTSLAAACSLTSYLYYGLDAGYRVVQLLVGQPDSPQAVIAGQGLIYLALPIAFSAVLGFLKEHCRGGDCWLAMVLALIGTIAGLEFSLDMHPANVCTLAPWTAASIIMALAAWRIGKVAYRYFSEDTDAPFVVGPALAIFVPAGIFFWTGETHPGLALEMAFYFVLASAAATITGFISRGKRFSQCLTVATVALSPVLISIVVNFWACLTSLYLDVFEHGLDIGWRALLSAGLIVLYTGTAIALGALKAAWLNRTMRS